MAKSNNSFIKRQRELNKKKKREEKQARKEERKRSMTGTEGQLENMLAYVDEYGNLTSKPPEKKGIPPFRVQQKTKDQ